MDIQGEQALPDNAWTPNDQGDPDQGPSDSSGDTAGSDEAVFPDNGDDPGDAATPDETAELPDDVPLPDEVLGLPLRMDGVLYAGSASIDITPTLDPERPVYIAGFGGNRVAAEIRDPLWVRALVLSRNREYVAILAADVVGITGYRADIVAGALDSQGWAEERVIVHALHNHAGPDTLGLWGPTRSVTGLDPEYLQRLTDAAILAVHEAAASAVPVTLRTGSARVGDLSPYFTSEALGGRNRDYPRMSGLIYDSRDPVVIDDTLTTMGFFDGTGRAVATVAHVNTHVEVSGGSHRQVSSDFAHPLRTMLEDRFGGVAMLWIGAEGGLQNPLRAPMPITDEDGGVVFQECSPEAVADPGDSGCFDLEAGSMRVDEHGAPIPAWERWESWARRDTYGRLLGRLAGDLLAVAPTDPDPTLTLVGERIFIPLENRFMEVAGTVVDPSILDPIEEFAREMYPEYLPVVQEFKDAFAGTVLDFDPDWLVTGPECPGAQAGEVRGCLPSRIWALRIGDAALVTAPGEMFPESWRGPMTGADAEHESAGERGPDSTFFTYSDPACADVPYESCRWAITAGDCDCLRAHAAPYAVLPGGDPEVPLRDLLGARHPMLLGMAGNMTGYLIPEQDYYLIPTRPVEEMFAFPYIMDTIEYLSDLKEHYEETVSIGPAAATMSLLAARRLAEELARQANGSDR
jgi:hypothetical protein